MFLQTSAASPRMPHTSTWAPEVHTQYVSSGGGSTHSLCDPLARSPSRITSARENALRERRQTSGLFGKDEEQSTSTAHALLSSKAPQPDLAVILAVEVRCFAVLGHFWICAVKTSRERKTWRSQIIFLALHGWSQGS